MNSTLTIRLLFSFFLISLVAGTAIAATAPGGAAVDSLEVESTLPTGSEWFDLIGTYRWRDARTAEVYELLRQNGAEAFMVNGLSMYGSPDDGVVLLDDAGWVVGFMMLSDYDFQGRKYSAPADADWPFGVAPGASAGAFANKVQSRPDMEFLGMDEQQYPGLQTGFYRHTRKGSSAYISGFGLRGGASLQLLMVMLPPRDLAAMVDRQLFPVMTNGRWGFIDQFGTLQVEAQFDSVDVKGGFSEGLVGVYKDGGWGYINTKGELVVPVNADWMTVSHFSEGRARVGVADPSGEYKHVYGYIDRTGKAITGTNYQGILFGANFSDGRCRVQREHLLGYIGRDGKEVIAPQYDNGQSFTEGLAVVRDAETKAWYYIDTTGARAFPGDWRYASPFSEGLAVVSSGDNGPHSIIDHSGATVADLQWTPHMHLDLIAFTDDRLRIKDGDRYGFVDREGYMSVLSDYLDAHTAFSDRRVGLARPDETDPSDEPPLVWGFMDIHGEEQSAFAFAEAEPYHEGLAAVYEAESGLWGFLDLDGAWAIEPIYPEKPEGFFWGLCKVGQRYINRKGVGVWKP